MQDQFLYNPRAWIPFFYQLANAGQPHSNKRKLRSREKRVYADQQENAK
jgi:hypothetical protein